jgi:hypothetical protein
MLNTLQLASIQTMIDQRQTQRAITRLSRAVAQALQLRFEDPSIVLAPHLGQPITLSNREALERWVAEALRDLNLPADSDALAPLRDHLAQTLEEVS